MSRKSKLTEENKTKILKMLSHGNYRETACAAVGIDPHTLRNWLRRGSTGEQPYASFCEAMDEAQAQAEAGDVKIIDDAGKLDWRAAAWKLSRRAPERWAEREPATATAKPKAGKVKIVISPAVLKGGEGE